MKGNAATLDLISSTIPQPHDPNPYAQLLRREGVYAIVGWLAPLNAPLDCSKLNIDRKSIGTILIGGIAETQEVLDFCGQHAIVSEIQSIDIDRVNEAFTSVDKARWRFVM